MANMYLSNNVNGNVELVVTRVEGNFDRSIIKENQCYIVVDDFHNLSQNLPFYINRLEQVQGLSGIQKEVVIVANSEAEYKEISLYDKKKIGNYSINVKKNYNDKKLDDKDFSSKEKDYLEKFFKVKMFQTVNNGILRNYIHYGDKAFEGSLADMYIQFKEMCNDPGFKQEISKFTSNDEVVNYFMQKYTLDKKIYAMDSYVNKVSDNEKGDIALGIAEGNHAMVNPEIGVVYNESKESQYTAVSEKNGNLVVSSPQVSNGIVGSNSTDSYMMNSDGNTNEIANDNSLSSNDVYKDENLKKKNEIKGKVKSKKRVKENNSGIVNFALIMLMIVSAIIMGIIVYSLI